MNITLSTVRMQFIKLLVLASLLLFTTPANSDINLDPDGVLKIYGDLRLRYEQDWDSTTPTGAKRKDRDRLRARARVGLKYQMLQDLLINVRVRTGDNQSQQSPHVTLWQDGGALGDQSDSNLDRAYLDWTVNQHGSIRLGRDGLNIWKPNEFLWDDDIAIDGFSFSCKQILNDDSKINWRAGFGFLPDGPDHFALKHRSQLSFVQGAYHVDTQQAGFVFAQAFLFIHDYDARMNRTTDNREYAISYSNIQCNIKNNAGLPISLGADFMCNFIDGPSTDSPNERYGFDLYAKLGNLKKTGDWQIGYYFARIEKWAVPRFMAQDDWMRFGTATQTRSSDYFGHELRAGYQINNNTNIIARLFVVDTITNREDGNRFRIDLNFKF